MSQKEIFKSERIREEYIRVQHPSGLTILLYPMKGYSSVYAIFGTHYGSTNRTFKTAADPEFVTVPDGIAHYLEHKMFESKEGDAFALFAKTGASANAFTSFDRTCYLFSCADHFQESLEILLSFVRDPYFTDENVQKEQGIIGQEIRMYDDNANWRVFFNLLGALYQNHPVKIDIAGTVESIAKIDKDLLYRCYRTFYSLQNMVLAIAGNFDPDEALAIADQLLTPDTDPQIQRSDYNEPAEIAKPEVVQQMEVSMPLFAIGYKMEPCSGIQEVQAGIETEIVNLLLCGSGSPLYRRLYDQGLISPSFGSDTMSGFGYFCSVFEGESRNPRAVYTALNQELERLKQEGIPKEDFENVKKALYGDYVCSFNSVERVANGLVQAHFSGVDIYDTVEVAARVTLEDVTRRLMQFDQNRCAISIVEPKA